MRGISSHQQKKLDDLWKYIGIQSCLGRLTSVFSQSIIIQVQVQEQLHQTHPNTMLTPVMGPRQ